jgi:hypothetical protein
MALARSPGAQGNSAPVRAAADPRFHAVIVAALAVAATCVLHLRGFGGAFLSDDLTHLYFIAHMDREHLLAKWAIARFVDPLSSGDFPYLQFAYRPIAFLSNAIEWRVFGTWAPGWRIANLTLHLVNIVLVYCLASRWILGRVQWHGCAMLPAAIFAAFPFAGEAIFWPAGRADVLAAFFSLLFLATFDRGPRPASVYRQVARVMFLLGALLSKESALPLPVVAFFIDLTLRASGDGRSSESRLGSNVIFAARDLAPSWLACAAYIGWRTVLFGTPLKVYRDSALPASLAEYVQRLGSYSGLLTRQPGIDPPWLWALVAALLITALLAGGIAGRRKPDRPVTLVSACALSAFIYVLAPALSLGANASVGDGARNFYVAWIYVSLALGLAAASTRISLAAGVVTVVWMLVAQAGSLNQWQAAAREMRVLLTAIPAFSNQLRADEYALLLLPDHVGVALFARDAEQAIVDWPVQTTEPVRVVAGMTEVDIPAWREHFTDGSIARLKGAKDFDMNRFAGVFCWSTTGKDFVRVAPPGSIADFDAWADALRESASRSNCMHGTISDVQ